MDIALDPFPYNGTTTTCEALWMGVPVVTLAGNRHASRVGASLLAQAGLPEWTAASRDDYVDIATQLARMPGTLSRKRSVLRDQIGDSPLCDGVGFCQRMETAFERIWNDEQT